MPIEYMIDTTLSRLSMDFILKFGNFKLLELRQRLKLGCESFKPNVASEGRFTVLNDNLRLVPKGV